MKQSNNFLCPDLTPATIKKEEVLNNESFQVNFGQEISPLSKPFQIEGY